MSYWKDPATVTPDATSAWIDPLKVNGTALADTEQLDPQVSVTPIGGAAIHRLSDGSAAKQTVWRKRRVRVSGNGWVPPTLSGLDWSAPVTVEGHMLAGPVTGYSDGPEESFDPANASWSWSFTLEES